MSYTFKPPTRFVGGHLHSIGNRCWCGYLTVPVQFHTRNERGEVVEDGKAQKRYFDYLRTEPDGVDPPCMAELNNQMPEQLGNNQVGKQLGGRRKGAGRPRKE